MSRKDKEIDLDQQAEFLRKISFFDDFDDHELRQFLAVSKWLKVPTGALIIKENTMEKAFYLLVKGEVEVIKSGGKGKSPIHLTTLATGDCFGEMALVTEIKRTADVKATRESFILKVEPDIVSTSNVFLQLKFYKRFCEIMVARLDKANKQMAGHGMPADEATEPEKVEPVEKKATDDVPEKAEAAPSQIESDEGKEPPDVQLALLPPMPRKEDRLTTARIQRRINAEQIFSVNPAVAAKISGLLAYKNDEDYTRKFADLILLDPVLSCRVIQTANSPYFRRASEVASVPHAMIIAGIKHIENVVVATIETTQDIKAFSGFTPIAKTFWQHAVVVGKIAELLKDVIRINVATDIYLAGLLHDFGMFAVDTIKPDIYPQLLRPDTDFKTDLRKAEKEYLGTDHGQVGLWLGESLGLPQAYLEVMRFHHSPERAHSNILSVALVHLANIFAAERGVCMGGYPDDPKITARRTTAWSVLQEQHKPFLDVNVLQFIDSFSEELDKGWSDMIDSIPV